MLDKNGCVEQSVGAKADPPAGSLVGPAARINARLDAGYAPAWNPNRGAKLIGRVLAIEHFTGGAYGTYPILTVQPFAGEPVSVHAFHQVLAGQLARARPQIGELVGIKYEGKVERDGAADYHAFRVVVDRPDVPFDWGPSEHAGEPDGPPAPDEDDIPF